MGTRQGWRGSCSGDACSGGGVGSGHLLLVAGSAMSSQRPSYEIVNEGQMFVDVNKSSGKKVRIINRPGAQVSLITVMQLLCFVVVIVRGILGFKFQFRAPSGGVVCCKCLERSWDCACRQLAIIGWKWRWARSDSFLPTRSVEVVSPNKNCARLLFWQYVSQFVDLQLIIGHRPARPHVSASPIVTSPAPGIYRQSAILYS